MLSRTDGLTGFEAFIDGEYDLVIVDRSMPGINGFKLAKRIKAQNAAVKVMMLTGFGETMLDDEDASNVDMIVSKPVTLEELGQHLGELFDAGTQS